MARKQPASKAHENTAEDNNFKKDFARDFFGTNEPHDKSLILNRSEATGIQKKEKSVDGLERNQKEQQSHRKQDEKNRNTECKESLSEGSQRQALQITTNYDQLSSHVYSRSSKRAIAERFLELRNEFLLLSEKFRDANLSVVSKRLTQVLAERQRLMRLLLVMNETSSFSPELSPHTKQETPRDQKSGSRISKKVDQRRSKNGSSEREVAMSKRTKSVHWSDEHLGGSIIQDPTQYTYKLSYPSRSTDDRIRDIYNGKFTKPPPNYHVPDRQTLISQEKQWKDHAEDSNLYICKRQEDIKYVEEILDEAAELRREAWHMLRQARYLEQLCNSDDVEKHAQNKMLPSYSFTYR